MGVIKLIIAREYAVKIKNKWFLIMTILGPLLIAGIMILPVWLRLEESKAQRIIVVDETELFRNNLPSGKNVEFVNLASTQEQGEALLTQGEFTGMLYIPKNFTKANSVIFKYKKNVDNNLLENIQKKIEEKYFELTLRANAIPDSVIHVSKIGVQIARQRLKDDGKSVDNSFETKAALGFILAGFIYFFILFYGVQIMRGVMEEKTNRIVEVIVSSVKPFQLLMGKIIGIALVGLTQFLLWVVLTLAITLTLNNTVFKDIIQDANLQKENIELVEKQGIETNFSTINSPSSDMELIKDRQSLADIPFISIIISFGFYFLGGYLLYGALYAAVGSAVDTETDTQQFMLPLTIPIIVSFIFAQYVTANPHGTLSVWLSIIPFTSPIIMMVRMPFDPPAWQIVVSVLSLISGFIFTTWCAAKIYRTGILMYGKKVTWKEIGKWLFHKS
jgi:ABC-2 type transport system permease protein